MVGGEGAAAHLFASHKALEIFSPDRIGTEDSEFRTRRTSQVLTLRWSIRLMD
jgi:hypothetical protein